MYCTSTPSQLLLNGLAPAKTFPLYFCFRLRTNLTAWNHSQMALNIFAHGKLLKSATKDTSLSLGEFTEDGWDIRPGISHQNI